MSTTLLPVSPADPVNAQILSVSEDKIQGFLADPFLEIARRADLPVEVVLERLRAMLAAGTIRRVRQTLLATNLAKGALVAWVVDEANLQSAFDYVFQKDPFSGHVVIRSTDTVTAASKYRLWTTVKVPSGYSISKHCEYLRSKIGASRFILLPAKKLFALGVGHVRRKTLEPGAKSEELGQVTDTNLVELSAKEWRVLNALKRELTLEEISQDFWAGRAEEAGVLLSEFLEIAKRLNERKVIGRFSTFLEHVKPLSTGERVTRFNGLFHWAVPAGREIETGRQIGRFHVMTHAYWREAGPEFFNVNIMGVAHGMEKPAVLEHKRAIDEHLAAVGIPISYTNVFWGGRSEIKPSEIFPEAYEKWCAGNGIDVGTMRSES